MTGQRAKLSLCMGGCFFFFYPGIFILSYYMYLYANALVGKEKGKGQGEMETLWADTYRSVGRVLVCNFVFFCIFPYADRWEDKEKVRWGGYCFPFLLFGWLNRGRGGCKFFLFFFIFLFFYFTIYHNLCFVVVSGWRILRVGKV